ncbi:transglycosylase domain-containing protein [Alkalibaculum bacchi]|uniref:transglycosylase domain-containing protein n=1 Tax=Alkalibaculum bacchi TaxID=645887 RepID=UPI0026EC3C46|nr:PBP1A family penicillin-binding protein [Alkalibaculum bacchi]
MIKKLILVISIILIAIFVAFGCSYSPVDVQGYEYKPNQKTQYISSDGELIEEAYNQNRTYVKLQDMPQDLKDGIIAVEDSRFYSHKGYDLIGIVRALFTNVKEGEITEGASTITQQLARNLFEDITTEQTVMRKVNEVLVARQLEKKYSKDQILEMYLNEIYLGSGTYGVQEASIKYFGKDVKDLDLAESAMLAGLPQAPSAYAPDEHFELAKKRQEIVLRRMVSGEYITEEEANKAKEAEITIVSAEVNDEDKVDGEYRTFINQVVLEYVRILQERYPDREITREDAKESIQNDGLTIQTTLDSRVQALGVKSINDGLRSSGLDKLATGALVTVDHSTGAVLAYYGGNTEIDMASKPRSPASVIKPFIYAKAFDEGLLTPNSLIKDESITIAGYTPRNVDNKFVGYLTAREAIVDSRNIPAIKTMNAIGANNALEYIKKFGITTIAQKDYNNLAIATGGMTNGITPIEMTQAFSAFSNEGVINEVYFIKSITDTNKKVIYERQASEENNWQMMKPETAREMKDILVDVVGRGTGTNARTSYITGGKTGTSNENKDLWFVGFTGNITTSVWIGNVDNKSLSGSSSRSAQIYGEYTNKLIKGNLIQKNSLEPVDNHNDTTSIFILSPDTNYTQGQSISIGQVISIVVPVDQVGYFEDKRVYPVEIDKESGKLFVEDHCPVQNKETRYYLMGQGPTQTCDLDHLWDKIEDFFNPVPKEPENAEELNLETESPNRDADDD